MLRTAAFLRAAHAAGARRSGASSSACRILKTSGSHSRLVASAGPAAVFATPFSSSSSSSDLPPPSSFESQQPIANNTTTPQQPPTPRPARRPSPRRGGSGSGARMSVNNASLSQSHQLPLDLPSYRRRLARAADPSAALTTLEEMHRAGLSFDAEAALLALRLCTLHPTAAAGAGVAHQPHNQPQQPNFHMRDALRLLRRLTGGSTHPNSPVAHAAYALALAGCARHAAAAAAFSAPTTTTSQQHAPPPPPHEPVLAAMRRQGVKPSVGMYQEVARACLEPVCGGDAATGRVGALAVMREVVEMDPLREEEGQEEEGPVQGQGPHGQQGRLSVKCRDAGEAAWVQALLQATATGNNGEDVDTALALLATGLKSFAVATEEANTAPPAVAFACNLALAACIRAGRWAEASAVEEVMRGARASPDAWAVNALLARALAEEEEAGGGMMMGKGLAASRLLQALLAAHPALRPSASAYAAVLRHGGCDALLDLLAAMQRIRGPGAVPAYAYRMLLRALDGEGKGDGGRLVGEGLPLVAHAEA